jgi:hypothetical protein
MRYKLTRPDAAATAQASAYQAEFSRRIDKAMKARSIAMGQDGYVYGWVDPKRIIDQMRLEGWTLTATAKPPKREDWNPVWWLVSFIVGLLAGAYCMSIQI